MAEVLRPVAASRGRLLPLEEDGRSNPAGLEARMPGCLETWRLVGWPAGWQDWIVLDVSCS